MEHYNNIWRMFYTKPADSYYSQSVVYLSDMQLNLLTIFLRLWQEVYTKPNTAFIKMAIYNLLNNTFKVMPGFSVLSITIMRYYYRIYFEAPRFVP